jgi:aryl-alcohol dehydrogenase-like predicted oxidoreductase
LEKQVFQYQNRASGAWVYLSLCSTAQIALAWVMAQNGVVPIPGTTKIQNLLANIQAEKIILNSEELGKLNALQEAQGARYSEAAMKAYGFTT